MDFVRNSRIGKALAGAVLAAAAVVAVALSASAAGSAPSTVAGYDTSPGFVGRGN